jgi:hypothetical protein
MVYTRDKRRLLFSYFQHTGQSIDENEVCFSHAFTPLRGHIFTDSTENEVGRCADTPVFHSSVICSVIMWDTGDRIDITPGFSDEPWTRALSDE